MGCEIGGGGDGRRKLNRGREVAIGKRGSGSSWDTCCSSMLQNFDDWDVDSWSPKTGSAAVCQEGTADRRKRRRTKRFKNKEEVETQRMTHIAVERNRRRLMNEYLAVLRSLMPASYVQKVRLPHLPEIYSISSETSLLLISSTINSHFFSSSHQDSNRHAAKKLHHLPSHVCTYMA